MMLLIDNYDSFTYNLVQYFGELGQSVSVARNDRITLEKIKALKPSHIVISPGPCTPKEAGLSCEIIKTFYRTVPMLGVCLGHQCIGQTFGAAIVRAKHLMHGKTSKISHDQRTIFKNIPNPFTATRYHSLVIAESTLPQCLEIIARSDDGEIMGVRHRDFLLWGVQFHPESILTVEGKTILKNFLECSRR